MKPLGLCLALISLGTTATLAFVPASTTSSVVASRSAWQQQPPQQQQQPSSSSPRSLQFTSSTPPAGKFVASNTQLYARKYQGTNDGTDRGIFLQLIILGLCTWLFTIPPEFRRAYLCPADIYCQEEGSCQKECVTPDQWIQGVKEYYQNGGGIQWDFSIDPKTKAANQAKLDAILNNMNGGAAE